MNFAFIIMGNYEIEKDRAVIGNGSAQIVGVKDVPQACEAAKQLIAEGVGCIELCGAFGEKGAQTVIEATSNKTPIGYITHLPIQDEVYRQAFSKK